MASMGQLLPQGIWFSHLPGCGGRLDRVLQNHGDLNFFLWFIRDDRCFSWLLIVLSCSDLTFIAFFDEIQYLARSICFVFVLPMCSIS